MIGTCLLDNDVTNKKNPKIVNFRVSPSSTAWYYMFLCKTFFYALKCVLVLRNWVYIACFFLQKSHVFFLKTRMFLGNVFWKFRVATLLECIFCDLFFCHLYIFIIKNKNTWRPPLPYTFHKSKTSHATPRGKSLEKNSYIISKIQKKIKKSKNQEKIKKSPKKSKNLQKIKKSPKNQKITKKSKNH